MDRVTELLILLGDRTGIKIIHAFQGKKLPPLPFVDVQVINKDEDGYHRMGTEALDDYWIEETGYFRTEATLQINVHAENQISGQEISEKIKNEILFKSREELLTAGFGVVSTSGIINISEVRNGIFQEHTYTFDLVVDYTEKVIRKIENTKTVEFHGNRVSRNDGASFEVAGCHNYSGILDLHTKD